MHFFMQKMYKVKMNLYLPFNLKNIDLYFSYLFI